MPPRADSSIHNSALATFGISLILVLALFPNLFHLIWTAPFSLLPFFSSRPTPTDRMWTQKQFTLQPKSRGCYLITDQVLQAVPEIRDYKVGLLNLFVQHTSCGLTLNENCDPTVREDMADALDRLAPEQGPKGEALYRHDDEGLDDMPAHIKSSLVGASVTIPIKDGRLATGTWQGVYLVEARASKHQRRLMATIQGEKA